MSTTCHTSCLDCEAIAPAVGDFGYIGYPSLEEDRGDGEAPNFGYVYRGLEAIHLVTWELDTFRAFLEEHTGHRVVTFTEGEPAFEEDEDALVDLYEDEEDSLEDEAEAWELGEEEEDYLDVEAEPSEGEFDEEAAEEYPPSYYRLDCSHCDETFQTAHFDNIARITEGAIEQEQAQRFLQQVFEEMDAAFYRSELPPEDLEGIASFLKKHGAHGVVASLVPHR